MPDLYYTDSLYPFQDSLLKLVKRANTDFYLTGGTALSRFYLNHRYSDDLDFFVIRTNDFKEQCDRIFNLLKEEKWDYEVGMISEDFVRIFVARGNIKLKVDFVNDIDIHYGDFLSSKTYPRVDHWRNILSNKICSLSRLEAKDVVDIVYVSRSYTFLWEEIVNEAKQKDLWVEPLSVSKYISEFDLGTLSTIKWVDPVNVDAFKDDLNVIQKDILLGGRNSLTTSDP